MRQPVRHRRVDGQLGRVPRHPLVVIDARRTNRPLHDGGHAERSASDRTSAGIPIFLGHPRTEPRSKPLVRLDRQKQRTAETRWAIPQDRQWFINTLRRLGYTEAAEEAERELPDPVSTDELIKFTDRFSISRDEVMSQMGGSP